MKPIQRSLILPIIFAGVATSILFVASIIDYIQTIGVQVIYFWIAELIIISVLFISLIRKSAKNAVLSVIGVFILGICVRFLFIQFNSDWLDLSIKANSGTLKDCADRSIHSNGNSQRCLYFSTLDGEWGRAIYFDPKNICFPKSPQELQRIDETEHKHGEGFTANSNSIYVKKIKPNYCLLQFSQQQSQDLPPDFRSIM